MLLFSSFSFISTLDVICSISSLREALLRYQAIILYEDIKNVIHKITKIEINACFLIFFLLANFFKMLSVILYLFILTVTSKFFKLFISFLFISAFFILGIFLVLSRKSNTSIVSSLISNFFSSFLVNLGILIVLSK